MFQKNNSSLLVTLWAVLTLLSICWPNYGDYLYRCSNSGILTCYQAVTGHLFSARSLTTEEGETAVIQAGPTSELVSNYFFGENCLATPAISKGTIYLQGRKYIFAFR